MIASNHDYVSRLQIKYGVVQLQLLCACYTARYQLCE